MVDLIHCGKKDFADQVKNRKFVCFGAGKRFLKFLKYWVSEENINNILCVIDQNKVNEKMEYLDKDIPIYSMEYFISNNQCDDFILIITNLYDCMEIVGTLDQYALFNDKICFIEYIIDDGYQGQTFNLTTDSASEIDKIIHYCWFGGTEIPGNLQKCIDSWKKYCPDYKIIRWDESNYDVAQNRYMKDAYDAQKWGFVPDFARLDIIYNHGGIYLDTDVELIKSLDVLRKNEMYCGFEDNHYVNLGLGFGAVKGHGLIKRMLDMYDDLIFDIRCGNPTASPVYQTQVLSEEGIQINNTFQRMENVTVYPSEVLSPIGFRRIGSGVTRNTVSIHHYDASWVEDRLKNKENLKKNKDRYFQRAKNVFLNKS
ncbi:hypothetical protein MCJ35_05995 [Enterocloster sp. OA13]|uniref:glycosyltransferase family 32 protein n=1 Tax=Enterocloster sp. OA13 TaxID=2914161 RepID=UPI0004BCC65C|nr:hypothetical protein [Enterocloster sp. OA13]